MTRADGSTATFVVDKGVVSHTRGIRNTTNRAELRLITCGGTYDDDKGYLSNVVASDTWSQRATLRIECSINPHADSRALFYGWREHRVLLPACFRSVGR